MHYHDKNTAHTSPQHYTDLDGMSRSFTMVDHDKKTKISVPNSNSVDTKQQLEEARESFIQKILAIPGSYCPTMFMDYTIRGGNVVTIEWNEAMLRDRGVPLTRLIELHTLASNMQDMGSYSRLSR